MAVVYDMSKIGRNDPCYCGSGKKYKACCADKDAKTVRENVFSYDIPLLIDGDSIAECEAVYESAEEIAEAEKESRRMKEFVREMKAKGEWPEDEAVIDEREEKYQARSEEEKHLLAVPISKEDNHVTRTISQVSCRLNVESFIMSRNNSEGEFAKPEYAAKGFTWYIRQAPEYGNEVFAYFKDVDYARAAMEDLAMMEDEFADHDEEIKHDLNAMRKLIIYNREWPTLPTL